MLRPAAVLGRWGGGSSAVGRLGERLGLRTAAGAAAAGAGASTAGLAAEVDPFLGRALLRHGPCRVQARRDFVRTHPLQLAAVPSGWILRLPFADFEPSTLTLSAGGAGWSAAAAEALAAAITEQTKLPVKIVHGEEGCGEAEASKAGDGAELVGGSAGGAAAGDGAAASGSFRTPATLASPSAARSGVGALSSERSGTDDPPTILTPVPELGGTIFPFHRPLLGPARFALSFLLNLRFYFVFMARTTFQAVRPLLAFCVFGEVMKLGLAAVTSGFVFYFFSFLLAFEVLYFFLQCYISYVFLGMFFAAAF